MPFDEKPESVEFAETVAMVHSPGAGVSGQTKAGDLTGNLTGEVLDNKYELTAFLGAGGMSEVYKARHKITGKTVAVKILHPKRTQDETTVRRLKQEAQAAGALTHASILGIHDFGIAEDLGLPFLVMDFIDGISFSDLLSREGPLKLDRFLRIMQQVASALAHAQEHNVVHRDLKPSNIMIQNMGTDTEQAKIVDFGIARLIDDDADTMHRLTQTGEMFGSPLYMSPEQCAGTAVDYRSDIYSFGCVMYEALSGTTPHQGESVLDTIHKHINETPPALKAPQLDDNSRNRLEAVIFKCLAKVPQQRYQKASAIESELKKLEQASGGGALAHIEQAWNLVQAKNAAKRKTTVPLLVATLITTAVLSIVSSVCLVFNTIEAQRCYRALLTANSAKSEYFKAYIDMTMIYKKGQSYLLTRDKRQLYEIAEDRADARRHFIEINRVLIGNPAARERYNVLGTQFDQGVQAFVDNLDSLPAEGGKFNMFKQVPQLKHIVHESTKMQRHIRDAMDEEDKQLAVMTSKAESAQLTLIVTAILALLLNSAVVAFLIAYFVRLKANIKKQKEKITQSALNDSAVR